MLLGAACRMGAGPCGEPAGLAARGGSMRASRVPPRLARCCGVRCFARAAGLKRVASEVNGAPMEPQRESPGCVRMLFAAGCSFAVGTGCAPGPSGQLSRSAGAHSVACSSPGSQGRAASPAADCVTADAAARTPGSQVASGALPGAWRGRASGQAMRRAGPMDVQLPVLARMGMVVLKPCNVRGVQQGQWLDGWSPTATRSLVVVRTQKVGARSPL
jgi:hypothetical protein